MADKAMTRVMLPGGQVAEFPADMKPDAIETAVRSHLGIKTPPSEPIQEAQPDPTMEMAGRILNPGQPKERDIIQKVGDVVLPPLALAPTIAAGGELLPAAPAIGRALTSGVLGGAKAASEGKGPGGIAWDAVVDTLLGSVTEGVGKVAGVLKVPKIGWTESLGEKGTKVARSAAGREAAGAASQKAAAEAAKQLPANMMVDVPRLSRKGPIPLMEAVTRLNKLDDPSFSVARRELIDALNAADKGQLGPAANRAPFAGQIFGKFSPKERFTYKGTPVERAMERIRPSIPGVMSGAQAEGTAEAVPGVPNAVLPLLSPGSFSELVRHARPHL